MNIKQQYEQNGFVGPLEIISKEDALALKSVVLELEDKIHLMNSDYRCKSNVLFPFVDEISRNPKLISYLTEFIGPDIYCWDTLFWIKKPGDGKDVSFHQDATYWNFDNKHLAATVWFAFDDVTEQHGSIEYIQGSHTKFQYPHIDVKTDTNLLMRGQTVDIHIPKKRVKTTVPAGHVLIHSPFIVHGSGPNIADSNRVAMGMIFVSTKCKPLLTISPESAILVAGEDHNHYMIHDTRPSGNWQEDLIIWRNAYDRQHDNYYRMEQKPNNAYSKFG